MKMLIIGSGGREHAIGLALSHSPNVSALYFASGNGGTHKLGINVDIPIMAFEELSAFVQSEGIALTIVGPEGPLVAGIVDYFIERNQPIIGPSSMGAQLEGSKAWSKMKMVEYGIPTASYEVFTDYRLACRYVKSVNRFPVVIKADGLAAGKGVVVAETMADALDALTKCFIEETFAQAGQTVVIESFLKGQEASVLAFTDGHTILPMTAAQDHKRIFDGDQGPNTGGMGTYSPAPIVTPEIELKIYNDVFLPLLQGFKKDNIVYKGIVFAGLMIDGNTVNVIEFNARFGDPETQVILPRLQTDLADIFWAIWTETLSTISLKWVPDSVVCVVLASRGYPETSEKGMVIEGLEGVPTDKIIHAGTKRVGDSMVTDGGRVLGIIGEGSGISEAISVAYERVEKIHFDGMQYRRDIGQKAL